MLRLEVELCDPATARGSPGAEPDGELAGDDERRHRERSQKLTLDELRALPNVTLRRNTMATGLYDHGYLLAREALADGEARVLDFQSETTGLSVVEE